MASIECAKITARRDEKHLSAVIWCVFYHRFDGMVNYKKTVEYSILHKDEPTRVVMFLWLHYHGIAHLRNIFTNLFQGCFRATGVIVWTTTSYRDGRLEICISCYCINFTLNSFAGSIVMIHQYRSEELCCVETGGCIPVIIVCGHWS